MENEIRKLREEFSEYVLYADALIQKCQSDYDESEKIKQENEYITNQSRKFIESITNRGNRNGK